MATLLHGEIGHRQPDGAYVCWDSTYPQLTPELQAECDRVIEASYQALRAIVAARDERSTLT